MASGDGERRNAENLEETWSRIPEGLPDEMKVKIFRREIKKFGSPSPDEIDEFLRGKGMMIPPPFTYFPGSSGWP